MNKIETKIEGLYILEPKIFGDSRGFFMETYSRRDFETLGITDEFVQDNHSKSARGVLRGLHFQRQQAQGKLVRVIAGSVLDVAVDLRVESPSFGQWEAVVLSAENKRQFYIPPRFAHGFLTLEDNTEFVYKCTNYYHPQSDGGIRWNDPQVKVDWQLDQFGLTVDSLLLSTKDQQLPFLGELDKKSIFVP